MSGHRRTQVRWQVVMVLVLAAVVAFGFHSAASWSEEKSAAEEAPQLDERALSRKLETILENQQVILERFASLKEEVRIIQVRAAMLTTRPVGCEN